jgi:twitching motility protein PilT
MTVEAILVTTGGDVVPAHRGPPITVRTQKSTAGFIGNDGIARGPYGSFEFDVSGFENFEEFPGSGHFASIIALSRFATIDGGGFSSGEVPDPLQRCSEILEIPGQSPGTALYQSCLATNELYNEIIFSAFDSDGDGVLDTFPGISNVPDISFSGPFDTDGDGSPDLFPSITNVYNIDMGAPIDTDGDGIPDEYPDITGLARLACESGAGTTIASTLVIDCDNIVIDGDFIVTGDSTIGGDLTADRFAFAYRGALMASPDPEDHNPYAAEAPDEQTWRLRRTGGSAPFLEDLRMPPFLLKEIKESVNKRGLVLISGSFGSGKTTTSAGCLQTWVRSSNEVGITIEDPPEFPLSVPEGQGKIYQIDITDRDPAVAIKHMRRHAPRYVFLGEIRTPEAARELLHMSASGPLVLCTIHASDPIQALTSLILFASSAMEPDMARQLTARCVSLIVHQELVNGTMQAQMLTIADDDFGIQSKIRSGRYDLINEDFDNQKIKRQNAATANRTSNVRR